MDSEENGEAKSVEFIPNLHLCTRSLIMRLRGGKPGDVLTDAQLTEACGMDTSVNGPAYGYLQSAIRWCLNNHRIVWERQRGMSSLKCVEHAERMSVSDGLVRRSHRMIHRGKKVLASVEMDALDDTQKRELLVRQAHIGTLDMFTRKNAVTRLVESGATTPVNFGLMLEHMKPQEKVS